MKYLTTGATGFIGPHLVKKLVGEGHTCRCLVRSSSKTESLKALGVELVEGDITRSETIEGIGEEMDCVLHLATIGHLSNFTVTESMFETINVQGTANVMQEALRAGVKRIVHCSSTAAMGICPDIPADEKSKCFPHHPYGRSKRKAEKAILAMVAEQKLPAVIVRFSLVYGPGEPRDMLKLARLTKKGLFPKIGNRPKLTPLIYMDDAIEGLLLAAQKGKSGEVYLITNRDPLPFDEIRTIFQEALGIKKIPIYVPEWAALGGAAVLEKLCSLIGKTPPIASSNIKSTLADRVFSIEKARADLGFEPRVDPRVGLAETAVWYQENGWL